MKIKVLYVQETISSGGVERRRLSLAKYLDKEKYEIKIICTFCDGPIPNEIRKENVEVITIGRFKHLLHFKQYRKILSIIKEFKPHIIHGAVFEGVILSAISGFLSRVPITIIEETSDPQNRSERATCLLKFLSFFADKVIAISPSVLDYLLRNAHIKKSKLKLINNGVEIPRFVDDEEVHSLKKSLKIDEKDFVIGSVGRIHNDHKLFTNIIEAVSLLENNSSYKILIVGKGPDEDFLKAKADTLGLSNQLIMAGFQSDTAPYYKVMDIFCIASKREGFGLVAAEAMLHSLPVIATSVGGLKDVVLNEKTGFLAPPKRADIIAEKIAILKKDPQLRYHFGKNGYERALKEYSANDYVKKIDRLYNELCLQKKIKA